MFQILLDLGVAILKLLVTIRMLGPFEGFGVGLQATAQVRQQHGNCWGTDGVSLLAEGFGQLARTFTRPPQGRHGIPRVSGSTSASRAWRRRGPARSALATAACLPDSSVDRAPCLQLRSATVNGGPREPRSARYRCHPTAPQNKRVRCRDQTALFLVEARENGGIFFLEIVLADHRHNIARYFPPLFKLFFNGPLGIAYPLHTLFDTLDMAYRLYPAWPHYSLEHVATRLRIANRAEHRALSDARLVTEIFLTMLKEIPTVRRDDTVVAMLVQG